MAAPAAAASSSPAPPSVAEQLRRVMNRDVPGRVLSGLIESWERADARNEKKLAKNIAKDGDDADADDFVKRLKRNVHVNVRDAKATTQLGTLKTLGDFQREHPTAAVGTPAVSASSAPLSSASAAKAKAPAAAKPAHPAVAPMLDGDNSDERPPPPLANNTDDDQFIQSIERAYGGPALELEMSNSFPEAMELMKQHRQYVAFAREHLAYFQKHAAPPHELLAGAQPAYEPVVMDAAAMRRLSCAHYAPFERCAMEMRCVGEIMGTGPLCCYVHPAQLEAWECAPGPRAPSSLPLCVRCIASAYNSIADLARKEDAHATPTLPPFYFAVERPGGYLQSVMRVPRVQGGASGEDSLLLPFLEHNIDNLCVSTVLVHRADGTTQTLKCVADKDTVLYSDGSQRPRRGAAQPDTELHHDAQTLTLEGVLFARLVNTRTYTGAPGNIEQDAASVRHQDNATLLDTTAEAGTIDPLRTVPLSEIAADAQLDVLMRPFSHSLVRLVSALRQGDDSDEYVEALRTHCLLQPREHQFFSVSTIEGLSTLLANWPPMDSHLALYLLLARIEYGRRVADELRRGARTANNYQSPSGTNAAPTRSRQRAAASSAAAAAAPSSASEDPHDPATSANTVRTANTGGAHEALLRQLELFENAHVPLLSWYRARIDTRLDYDDGTLLSVVPGDELLSWSQLLGVDIESPLVGGDSNTNTWYQLARPRPDNFQAPGDVKYVVQRVRVEPTEPSHARIMAHAELLSLLARAGTRVRVTLLLLLLLLRVVARCTRSSNTCSCRRRRALLLRATTKCFSKNSKNCFLIPSDAHTHRERRTRVLRVSRHAAPPRHAPSHAH